MTSNPALHMADMEYALKRATRWKQETHIISLLTLYRMCLQCIVILALLVSSLSE